MNFSVSGQKIQFGSKQRIARTKNPSQLKIQRPTTAQVQTSFKLGDNVNVESKDLEDKIDDYQRVDEGMGDLSFREDQIHRDEEHDGIEEWKASYISNQAMSDLQKKSADILRVQQALKEDRDRRRGKNRSINHSISNEQVKTGLNSKSSPTGHTNFEQSKQNIIFENLDKSSSTQLNALNQKNFFVSKLDEPQPRMKQKYGLQATYQPQHQRIASAVIQNSRKLHNLKRNSQGQKSQKSSNEQSIFNGSYSRTTKFQSKVNMQSEIMRESPQDFRSKSMASQKAQPAQNSVLRNILRSEYVYNAKPSKFDIKGTLNQSRDYMSYDRWNPLMSQDHVNVRINLPESNKPAQMIPQATRFANNKIMINLRQDGQAETISGRLNGTVNRDSIRRTTEERLATGEEKQSQNNQIIPDTVRTFQNHLNSGGPTSMNAIQSMIYTSKYNSPEYTLMNDKYGTSNIQSQEARKEHDTNMENMEQLNISLLKQLKEERKSKLKKNQQRNSFNTNTSLGVKKAKITQVKRRNNQRFSAPKIIQVEGPSFIDVMAAKRNVINTETVMTNSIVHSEHNNSNFKSIEEQMQHTRIIFQRQFEENQKQEKLIKAHIELFAQQQQLAEDLDIDTQVGLVDEMVQLRLESQIDRVEHQNRQSKQMLKSVNEHNRKNYLKRFGHQEDNAKKSSRNSCSYGQSKALQNLFKLKDFQEQKQSTKGPQTLKIVKNQTATTDLNYSKETESQLKLQYDAVEAANQVARQSQLNVSINEDFHQIEKNEQDKVIDFSKHFKIAEVKTFDPQEHIDKISRSVTPQTRALIKDNSQVITKDSIIKQARPQKFDVTIHGRPPTSKDKLRYSKFNMYERDIVEEHNANKDDNFKRIPIVSNQVRQIFRPHTEMQPKKQKQLMPRPSLEKQRKAKIEMLGNFNIDHKKFKEMASHFDPFRLKVIMMPKTEAIPAGKNPDFFFVQGIDYLNIRDWQTAVRNFEKGCMINKNHYLCRFNLGYTLFLLGNYEQAALQYKILWNQCQAGNHPESRFSFVLYNKAVSELQNGDFTSSAKSSGQCVEIMKQIEKKKGGSIVFLTKMERDMILDMLQLEGYSHFRDKPGKADAKATGKCFEAADVRMGILEQEQIDQMNLNIENQQEQMAIEPQSLEIEPDQDCQNQGIPEQIFDDNQDLQQKEMNANQSNSQSQSISKQQLNEQKKSALYLNLGGAGPNEHSGNKISEFADPDEIRQLNANSSQRKKEGKNTFLADYMKQTVHDENESRNKLVLRQKSSSVSLMRSNTLSKKKRNRSLSIIKAKPFHIEADRANNALDFNKIVVDDKALKSQKNIKSQADKLYGQISWFMDDFKTRLEASVVAGRQGGDEMNAFKHGPPKDGEEQVGSDDEKKAEAKVATKRTNITNRNTQRNKNRNKLEMEVEKDLTNLKKILTKKQQQKQQADKANQQFMLADRERLTQIFQKLNFRKQMSQNQGVLPDQLKYDLEDIEELDDIITKFKAFRTNLEEEKRKFWLQSGHVSYLILKRGDILYEQGEDSADCQFWIVSGAATIVRSFIDHDLLFKINNEKRVNKAKLDESLLTYSSQHSEEHICLEGKAQLQSPSPFKIRPFESPEKDLLSNTDDGKIVELSEHSSTESLVNSPGSDQSERKLMKKLSLKERALKQLDVVTKLESDDFEREESKHPYQEFLQDLDKLDLTELEANRDSQPKVIEEPVYSSRFENGVPNAYNYVPMDQRPEFQKKKAPVLSLERQLSLDCKSMAAYRAVLKGPKKLGVQLKESKLEDYNKQFPKVRVAEKNLGKGMVFGLDIFEWWKNLKFNQKMIDQIEKTITDKIALVKFVKTFQKEKNEKLAKKQEEYLESLSPVRRATLLQQFSESCLDLLKKSKSSPSQGGISKRTSFKHLQIQGMSPDAQNQRQRSKSINQTPSPTKLTMQRQRRQASSKSILESNSGKTQQSLKSPELQTPGLVKQGTQSELGLQQQDTSKINQNLENYESQVKQIERTKTKVQKKIDRFRKGEIDNLEDGPHVPPPELKRENTCLITEDDTLIIQIPYTMDYFYEKHLEFLEQQQRDL